MELFQQKSSKTMIIIHKDNEDAFSIYLINRQMAILAQARLPQLLKGGALLQEFSRTHQEAEVITNKRGNYSMIDLIELIDYNTSGLSGKILRSSA